MKMFEYRQKAKEILSKMSLKEKAGQVTQLYYSGDNYEEILDAVRNIQPGSLILCGSAFAGNEEQAAVNRESIDRLQQAAVKETRNGIPILFGRDVIHGHRVVFPLPLTMASAFNPELVEKCYDAIRREAVSDGIKWTFAPMLDLCRDPRWGRIVEGPGEDPYLGECMAKAIVKGFQTDDLSREDAIAACAKHFVGYGASEGGRDYNHTEIGDYLLQNTYLPAFRSAISSGVATVMSSFNDINSIPVSGNRRILPDILRDQLGFGGLVVRDWEAVRQMADFSGFAADYEHAAALAIRAGVDMDMADDCYLKNAENLIYNGTITEEELNEAVLRILSVKLRMGLFEHPFCRKVAFDTESHRDLARKMAEESIVQLKNERNILPLSKTSVIGLSGPYLHNRTELVGTWALDTDYSLVSTPAEALRRLAPDARFVETSDNLSDEIMQLRNCEALILFLGESRRVTGEACSLADVELPACQRALAEQARRTGKPVIGVFCFGRPLALGNSDYLFDAILYAGHGGTCAAEAIAAVLFGDAEPAGRLSFTLPNHIGQIPLYYNIQPGARQINRYYKDENPYMPNYKDCAGAPSYVFGYGLSYTEFTFTNMSCGICSLSLDELMQGKTFNVSCVVSNTGKRAGSTVVQLYVQDVLASRMRPLRSLRAFEKVNLAPGESRKIVLNIGYKDLGFYLENGEFIVETGEYRFYLGENCLAGKLTSVTVTEH